MPSFALLKGWFLSFLHLVLQYLSKDEDRPCDSALLTILRTVAGYDADSQLMWNYTLHNFLQVLQIFFKFETFYGKIHCTTTILCKLDFMIVV